MAEIYEFPVRGNGLDAGGKPSSLGQRHPRRRPRKTELHSVDVKYHALWDAAKPAREEHPALYEFAKAHLALVLAECEYRRAKAELMKETLDDAS